MISIVVVAHNRLEYTKQCAKAILDGTDVEAELILVDSGSTDGTGEWLDPSRHELDRDEIPVRIEKYAQNVGAAVAYNKGFEIAHGDPIIRIDNDVVVPPGWASHLIAALESDPKLGMLASGLITDMAAMPIGIFEGGISYYTDPVWHDGGIGSWCIAMRRAMFDEIGVYRTLFGPYALNDNDLEKRAQNAGWSLGYLHGLRVGHLWSIDTPEEAEFNEWKMAEYHRQVETWNKVWSR
jgi:GT2 family glycosyltransferase